MRGLALGAALMLLGGCGESKPVVPPEPLAPMEITDRANGQTVRLQAGQELTVTLSECASCASKWAVAERPPMLTELAKADLGSGDDAAPAARANVTVQYLFRAERAGSGRLMLRDGGGQTLTYNIDVR